MWVDLAFSNRRYDSLLRPDNHMGLKAERRSSDLNYGLDSVEYHMEEMAQSNK